MLTRGRVALRVFHVMKNNHKLERAGWLTNVEEGIGLSARENDDPNYNIL